MKQEATLGLLVSAAFLIGMFTGWLCFSIFNERPFKVELVVNKPILWQEVGR